MFLPQISGPEESGVDNRAKSVTSSGGPTELPHSPHIDPALLAAWIVDRAKRNMAKIVLFPGNQHDLEQQPASQGCSHLKTGQGKNHLPPTFSHSAVPCGSQVSMWH